MLEVGRVLGTANLYRAEPKSNALTLPENSETCHVLPDITGGPEVWHYKDIVVCDVCERGFWVDINPDHLYREPYPFWQTIAWWNFRLARQATEILEEARRLREVGDLR